MKSRCKECPLQIQCELTVRDRIEHAQEAELFFRDREQSKATTLDALSELVEIRSELREYDPEDVEDLDKRITEATDAALENLSYSNDVLERLKPFLEPLDTSVYEKISALACSTCFGPIRARRFLLFGEKTIRCSSPTAIGMKSLYNDSAT